MSSQGPASRIPWIPGLSFCSPSSENRIPPIIGEGFRSQTNGMTVGSPPVHGGTKGGLIAEACVSRARNLRFSPPVDGGTKGGFFSFRRAGLSLRNPAGIGTPRDRILLQQHHRNKRAPASYTIPCNSGFGLPIFCVKKKQAPFGQRACFRPEGLARVAVRGYFMRTMRPA